MEEAGRIILVTGGAGFIGSHVCDALIADGHHVRCLDNLATGKAENLVQLRDHARFELLEADIRQARTCEEAVKGVERVVHLAALGSVPRSIDDPLSSEAVNLGGFLNMLEACRHAGVKRLVYASSSSVYGDSKASPKKEGQEGSPLSPYAVTKVMDEAYASLYHHMFGTQVIGLRFFNVFGERQNPTGAYAAAIPRFITRLMQHRPPQVHGDGRQARDFTYVGNAVGAVRAALACSDARAFGNVFNIAYGASTDLLTLIDRLKAHLAQRDPTISAVEVEHVADRAGDVRASLADVSRAREWLGYAPATDLDGGLARAVPWYVAHWS